MKSRGGEVVEISEGADGEWFVREPVTEPDAVKAVEDYLRAWWEEEHDPEVEPFQAPELATGIVWLARFVPAQNEDGQWVSVLRLSNPDILRGMPQRKRGAFLVRKVYDMTAKAARDARREAEHKAYTDLLNTIAERFPAMRTTAGCVPALGKVEFALPELQAPVSTYVRTWPEVYVQQRDTETFQRLYAGKPEAA